LLHWKFVTHWFELEIVKCDLEFLLGRRKRRSEELWERSVCEKRWVKKKKREI